MWNLKTAFFFLDEFLGHLLFVEIDVQLSKDVKMAELRHNVGFKNCFLFS